MTDGKIDSCYRSIQEERESYELKQVDKRDTTEYKKKYEDQSREIFDVRNTEGVRQQRREKEENDANNTYKKNDSYELKWAGKRDTKAYKKKCEKKPRENFAFRNTESVRQRVEKEENDVNDLCEKHDRYELEWAGEHDTVEYKKYVNIHVERVLLFVMLRMYVNDMIDTS